MTTLDRMGRPASDKKYFMETKWLFFLDSSALLQTLAEQSGDLYSATSESDPHPSKQLQTPVA